MTEPARLARIALALLMEPGHRDLGQLVLAVRRRRKRWNASGPARCPSRLRAAVRPRWGTPTRSTSPDGPRRGPTGSAYASSPPRTTSGRTSCMTSSASAGPCRTRSRATPTRPTASGCAARGRWRRRANSSVAVVGARASTAVRRARRRRPGLRPGRPRLDRRLRRRVRHRRGRPSRRPGRRRLHHRRARLRHRAAVPGQPRRPLRPHRRARSGHQRVAARRRPAPAALPHPQPRHRRR